MNLNLSLSVLKRAGDQAEGYTGSWFEGLQCTEQGKQEAKHGVAGRVVSAVWKRGRDRKQGWPSALQQLCSNPLPPASPHFWKVPQPCKIDGNGKLKHVSLWERFHIQTITQIVQRSGHSWLGDLRKIAS